MSSEGACRAYVRRLVRGTIELQGISDRFAPGIPDFWYQVVGVPGASGWIEMKEVVLPVRASTTTRLGVSVAQAVVMQRWSQAGALTWVLAKVMGPAGAAWWLIPGDRFGAPRTADEWRGVARGIWSAMIDRDQLVDMLTRK